MLLLYTSGKIKATEKFKSVTLALLLSTISISILAFIGYLITATRSYVMIFAGNPIFDIAMSVIFIIIAALFLISDFQIFVKQLKISAQKNTSGQFHLAWHLQ